MNRTALLALPILLLPFAFAGCVFETSAPVADRSPAAGEDPTALPPGYIAYYDGKDTVAARYGVSDGMVVVDGDILLGKASELLGGDESVPHALGKATGNIRPTAMPGQANSWPSGRIPYVIETDADRKLYIEAAIREWNLRAAVIWVPMTARDADYVAFVNSNEISSSVGRIGGRQLINFALKKGTASALHEMGHTAGLYHEQQRSDRAANIDVTSSSPAVLENNIDFTIMGANVGPYDHQSIMQYPAAHKFYFTWDAGRGRWVPTESVTANWIQLDNQAGDPAIVPGFTLSAGDLLTLRSMYMTALPYDAATSQSLTTGLAWPMVRPFKSGGQYFILHYNPADGQFRTYPFSPSQGMLNNPVEIGTWAGGWTTIEFYVIGSQTYALFFNRNDGSVSFYTMNANGKLGSVVETQTWATKWDLARIYKPTGTEQRYIFLYAKATGLARIFALKANGALDFARKTYEQTLAGYEDFQIMEDVPGDWPKGQFIDTYTSTYLLFHDQDNSAQTLQILNKNGDVGWWITTAGIGTGFTQANVYARNKRSEAMYYNKANGKLMICDIRPVFTGDVAPPTLTSAGLTVLRSYTTSAGYQVYNFNITPWETGIDPKGAERLFMFDPGLKRFWNSNLAPFPSI